MSGYFHCDSYLYAREDQPDFEKPGFYPQFKLTILPKMDCWFAILVCL